MRTCKEKFYGGVHEGLKVWVRAAREDGWAVEDVRAGPSREGGGSSGSPRKGSPVKKRAGGDGEEEGAPRIKLDVGAGMGIGIGVGMGMGMQAVGGAGAGAGSGDGGGKGEGKEMGNGEDAWI